MAEADVASGGPVRTTDMGGTEMPQLLDVLRDCLARFDDGGIPFAVMGGLAVSTLARPRWTHDIDLFLRPRDAVRGLELLADAGYEVERSDHEWLFKAWRDDIAVDLIFRSGGNLYFDDQMEARRVEREFLGVPMRVVCPEDLLVIKAAVDTELNHYHWYDALALLGRHRLDWPYVLRRGRSSRRRLLSLLVYADGVDVAVPAWVIRRLTDDLYGGTERELPAFDAPASPADQRTGLEEELLQRLRRHADLGDLDLEVAVEGDDVVITGQVETEERCRQIDECAAETLSGWTVRNRVSVLHGDGVPQVEVVS